MNTENSLHDVKECRLCSRKLPLESFGKIMYKTKNGVEPRLHSRCHECAHNEAQMYILHNRLRKIWKTALPIDCIDSMYLHRERPKKLVRFLEKYKTMINTLNDLFSPAK